MIILMAPCSFPRGIFPQIHFYLIEWSWYSPRWEQVLGSASTHEGAEVKSFSQGPDGNSITLQTGRFNPWSLGFTLLHMEIKYRIVKMSTKASIKPCQKNYKMHAWTQMWKLERDPPSPNFNRQARELAFPAIVSRLCGRTPPPTASHPAC